MCKNIFRSNLGMNRLLYLFCNRHRTVYSIFKKSAYFIRVYVYVLCIRMTHVHISIRLCCKFKKKSIDRKKKNSIIFILLFLFFFIRKYWMPIFQFLKNIYFYKFTYKLSLFLEEFKENIIVIDINTFVNTFKLRFNIEAIFLNICILIS